HVGEFTMIMILKVNVSALSKSKATLVNCVYTTKRTRLYHYRQLSLCMKRKREQPPKTRKILCCLWAYFHLKRRVKDEVCIVIKLDLSSIDKEESKKTVGGG